MKLISKELISDEKNISFYQGIDFDYIFNYPKKSNKMACFFIDSWVKEVKKWERSKKIESVLSNTEYKKFDFDNIDNSNIMIYQLCGVPLDKMFKIVLNKLMNNQEDDQWIPVGDKHTGALNLTQSLRVKN